MAGYGGKTEKSRKPSPRRPAGGQPPASRAPNPGYDREPVEHERVEMYQPQYPATFSARLKGGKGGGGYNANIQAEKSRKYE